jgi:hypothetical protein
MQINQIQCMEVELGYLDPGVKNAGTCPSNLGSF